jgi:O-antigen/teichoic acid export membrane protein
MLKKLFSETVIYGGTTILARLINYILVIIHTKVFEPGTYGVLSVFFSYAAILYAIYTYGMETTYFRFANDDDRDEPSVFNKILSSIAFTTIIFTSVLIFGAGFFAEQIGYPDELMLVKYFAIIFGIDALVAIPFARLRTLHKAKTFAFIKLTNVCLVVGLNYLFLIGLPNWAGMKYPADWQSYLVNLLYNPDLKLEYVVIANMVANGTFLVLLLPQYLAWRPTFSFFKDAEIYKYGLPLLGFALAAVLNEILDRILLKAWYPENELMGLTAEQAVGIYSACYKLSIFITLAVQGFKYAAEPFFFNPETKENPKIIASVMKYFIIVCSIAMVGVVMNLDWLKYFLRDQAYWTGIPVVPILLLANIFLGIYYNLSVWFKITDKTYMGLLISGTGVLITVVVNWLLIPILGYYGSAIATLLCYLGMVIYSYLKGKNVYPVPYKIGNALFFLSLASLLAWLAFQIDFGTTWLQITVKNLILFAFLLIAVYSERNFIKRLFKRNTSPSPKT